MKIAICDDIEKDGRYIQDILKATNTSSDFILYTDGNVLLNKLKNGYHYDIYFLDIDMPAIDGLTLGKGIRELHQSAIIIFITGHTRYVFDSFDCEPFHYLVKPINEKQLLTVFEKAKQKYQRSNHYHNIKVKTQNIRIKTEDIYYIECCRKHILYHMENETYDTIDKLASTYDALRHLGFFQVHQGYLVNMGKIKHFDDMWIILTNDQKVPMSVRKKSEVIAEYTCYIRK